MNTHLCTTPDGGWGPGCGAITHGVWRDLGRGVAAEILSWGPASDSLLLSNYLGECGDKSRSPKSGRPAGGASGHPRWTRLWPFTAPAAAWTLWAFPALCDPICPFIFLFKKYLLFIWLPRVSVAALGIFSCGVGTLSCRVWDLVP